MSTEPRCAAVESELEASLLERRAPAPEALAHARDCAGCAALGEELAALDRALRSLPQPEPPEALVAVTLRRARAALAGELDAAPIRVPRAEEVPAGYARELLRVLGGAVAALPVVLLWNAAVLYLGESLLAGMVAPPLRLLLGTGYVLAAAGWLSLVYGSLPFVAHRRARGRLQEVGT